MINDTEPLSYKQRIEEIVSKYIGNYVTADEYESDVNEATTQLLALMDEFGSELVGEDETYEGHTMCWAIEHRNQLRTEARTRKQELLK